MNNSRLLIIFLILFILFDIVLVGYYFLNNKKGAAKNTTTGINQLSESTSVLAKVGEENIYVRDLEHELESHPQKNDAGIKQKLMDKLILDSQIIQGGGADGIVALDSTIFNSPDKDYRKRIKQIEQIEAKVKSKSETIKGSIISIWFRNNDYIGPEGLERSKQIAFEKISALRTQIADKKITIEQAGDMIAADISLARIDPAFRNNAIFHFSEGPNEKISFSREFDTMLRSLDNGEVTEVFLAKNADVDTSKQYDAVYYVGQVKEKTPAPDSGDYNSWLSKQKNTYAVKIY